MTPVSLITTVLNEAPGIKELLNSCAGQSRLPDEVIVVDGGSTDGTVELIEDFFDAHPELHGKLIHKKGANIASGRNTAIVSSQYRIIAVTDGGCILHEEWLQKITAPFEKSHPPDVVAGYYAVKTEHYFSRCAGALLVPDVKKLNMERFLPSSRSIAFCRAIWHKVGGYPEFLFNAEDTLFDKKMISAGAQIEFVPDAIVYWHPRSTPFGLVRQFFNYRRCDIEAGIWKRTYARSMVTTLSLLGAVFMPWLWWSFALAFGASLYLLIRRLSADELILIPGIVPFRLLQEIAECTGLVWGAAKRFSHVR